MCVCTYIQYICEYVHVYLCTYNLIQNSQAVRPQKDHGEKRREMQGGSQEMAVMVG